MLLLSHRTHAQAPSLPWLLWPATGRGPDSHSQCENQASATARGQTGNTLIGEANAQRIATKTRGPGQVDLTLVPLIERSMKEQLNRVDLGFRSRFEVCFRIVFGSALLGRTETRTELPSPHHFFNPNTFFFHRYKQLIQVLGWLWDLSVAEEHIFSRAFFYFICLDVMLYSGEHDLGIYENWGSMALVLVWCGSSQGRGIETSGFLARKTYRKGKGRAWCFELRSHLESTRIIKDQEKESLEFKLPVNVSDHLSHSDSVTDGVTMCD